ncbi:glycosyltransferase family 2 protein [Floricoccus penangensis]|uniref:glycosyltransferase family 2 protein n=1 Tax=Floricoccus penangensis TaxID=1859475 RepID=UPI00203B137E|nr:glycosyltransferase family 2 protein [Floricoccus penangensis]URZ87625.1 glycosyltransferase family 2 protein [Floricoccus penangensis]
MIDLSIIIPMYNSESSIEKTINCILNQKYLPSYELIIVDDGSVDNSANIVLGFSESNPQIKLIRQSNQKQAEARNNGLRNAQGNVICFIDSDDTISENHFKFLVEPLLENRDLNLSISGLRRVFEDSDKEEVELISNLEYSNSNLELIGNYLTKSKEMDVGLWNKGFRREIIKSNYLTFNNENFFEDSLFIFNYLNCINFDEIIYINEATYNLYKGSTSTTTSFHPEIDALSKKYISKIKSKSFELGLDEDIIDAFVMRTNIYVSHHHIKYDNKWDTSSQKKLLSSMTNLKIIRNKYLEDRYKFIMLLGKNTTYFYFHLYKIIKKK